jgi:hypothetical protein
MTAYPVRQCAGSRRRTSFRRTQRRLLGYCSGAHVRQKKHVERYGTRKRHGNERTHAYGRPAVVEAAGPYRPAAAPRRAAQSARCIPTAIGRSLRCAARERHDPPRDRCCAWRAASNDACGHCRKTNQEKASGERRVQRLRVFLGGFVLCEIANFRIFSAAAFSSREIPIGDDLKIQEIRYRETTK